MPARIKLARQRLTISRLILDLMREASPQFNGRHDFGSQAESSMLVIAIAVGQMEGRPMKAGKLAEYAGMSRPTVIRKLRALEAEGIVERTPSGGFAVPAVILNRPGLVDTVRTCIQLVIRAGRELSRLDT